MQNAQTILGALPPQTQDFSTCTRVNLIGKFILCGACGLSNAYVLARTPTTSTSDQVYLFQMVQNSVMGTPSEFDGYGVTTDAFIDILHKQPRDRYTIFSQLFLPWMPGAFADSLISGWDVIIMFLCIYVCRAVLKSKRRPDR